MESLGRVVALQGKLSRYPYKMDDMIPAGVGISKRWREGNGVSAVWVEWASGVGNGSGTRLGAGNFAGVGACRCGRGARFARCTGGLGIGSRNTQDGEKSAAATNGHAQGGTDFQRSGRNCEGVRPNRHPGE